MPTLEEKIQQLEIVFSNPFSTDELLELEERLGYDIPNDIRWFMLTYGKCRFYRQCSVDFLDAKNIHRNLNFIGEFFPANVLPFAEDSYDNVYLLSLRRDSFGKVYYWRHDVGWDTQAEDVDQAMFESTLRLLAADFREFMVTLPMHEK